jgi:hypothetical protein
MYTESAVDADALGFVTKMLVQTTPLTEHNPEGSTRVPMGDMTLSITDIKERGAPADQTC